MKNLKGKFIKRIYIYIYIYIFKDIWKEVYILQNAIYGLRRSAKVGL